MSRGNYNSEENPIVDISEIGKVNAMWSYFMKCELCGKVVSKIKKSKVLPENLYCSSCGRKQTNTIKYGGNAPACSQTIKDKMNATAAKNNSHVTGAIKGMQTRIEKYGSCNNSAKNKQTCLEKYGTSSYLSSEEAKQKRTQAFLNKYGAKTYFESTEHLQKTTLSAIENNASKCTEVQWLDKNNWKGLLDSNNKVIYYHFKCNSCGNEFKDVFHSGKIPTCRKCHPYTQSAQEQEIADYVQSIYSGNIERNNRSVLNGREIDIYLPDLNFGIEFDGSYWHNGEHSNLEKMSMNKCSLIFIKDFEWGDIHKQRIIKSLIKSKLGIFDKKIFARKCDVRPVPSAIYNSFCDDNHLQHRAPANIKLGLYYNNELVQIESFAKPRFNNKYDWELIRECSKLGYQVIGGKEKLLQYFIRNYHPTYLLSYCDARFFNGNSYERCGFTRVGLSPENYVYNQLHTTAIYTRYQCQKHKLQNILGNKFDPNKTEKENMLDNGYAIIYDCGNWIFEMNCSN